LLKIANGTGSNLTSSLYAQPTLTVTLAANSTAFSVTNVVTIVPDAPGVYEITFTPATNLTGATAVTWTFVAGSTNDASTVISSLSLALDTSVPTVGNTVNVAFGAIVASNAAAAVNVARFKSYISSAPTNGYVTSTFEDDYAGITDTELGDSDRVRNGSLIVTNIAAANDSIASTVAGAAGINFVPTKAGTYQLTAYHDADNDGIVDSNESRQTIDIVVSARGGISAATSTVWQASATLPTGGAFDATSASNTTIATKQPVLCSKTTGTQCSNLLVTVRDTSGTAVADATGYVFAAEISGSGNLGISGTDATYTQAASARSVSLTSDTTGDDNVFNVSIWPDGTAGTGTVTVTATDPEGNKVTLGTKTVKFFGTVAKLAVVADSQNYKVLRAGLGTATGATTGLTSSVLPALTILATDSLGIPVGGLSITGTPTDVSVVSGSSVDQGLVANDAGYLYGGIGYYHANVTSATSSVSGNKTTVTYSTTLSTGAKISTTADFTIGGSIASESLALDKTSYAPGECMVVTITAKDSAGNPTYDGNASPEVTFSKAVGGTMAAGTYAAGKKTSSTTTNKCTVFAPSVAGAFIAQATSSATGTPTITASSSVTDANAGLLTQIDALNAKIVALNALIAKIMKKLGVK